MVTMLDRASQSIDFLYIDCGILSAPQAVEYLSSALHSVSILFVSYAQNFEDVMLHRALAHVKRGFYIDVGASDPSSDSVSRAFHELGWRGIHIEPLPVHAEALRRERPKDIVIEAAVAEISGRIPLYEVGDSFGISTCDIESARTHESSGFKVKAIDVASVALAEVMARHVEGDVHWMKIDVEGFEGSVIRSWKNSPVRPWIVLLESTEPRTTNPNHAVWEPDLIALGYSFVYFDGLNRFYVSEKHLELRASFTCGPSIFDQFKVNSGHWIVPTTVSAPIWEKHTSFMGLRRPHFGPVGRRFRQWLWKKLRLHTRVDTRFTARVAGANPDAVASTLAELEAHRRDKDVDSRVAG